MSIPNKDVNRHPPVGNEFHDTRIRKYPDGPQSEDGSPRLPTKVSFKGGSPPSCLNVNYTVRLNPSSREEEEILQMELLTNHESFVRNGVVLALKKEN